MATSNRQTLRSRDSETLIGSHLLGDMARQWEISQMARSEEILVVRDTTGYEEAVIADGEFTSSVWWQSRDKALAFRNEWQEAMIAGNTLLPMCWSLENEIRVGDKVGAAYIRPRDFSPMIRAAAHTSGNFSGRLVCEIFEGTLASPSAAADVDVLHNVADANTATTAINAVGPNFYSSTVALDNTAGRYAVVGATITSLDGHTGTQPTVTLAFPNASLPASFNRQAVQITHAGTTLATHVLHEGLPTGNMINELNTLAWPDGFGVIARGNYNAQSGALESITITGNQYGSTSSFTLAGPAPFTGTYTGTGNTTQARTLKNQVLLPSELLSARLSL